VYTFCVSVKVKRSVTLLCLCALPEKAILEKTYTVLGGTLNSTHSVTRGHVNNIHHTCFIVSNIT